MTPDFTGIDSVVFLCDRIRSGGAVQYLRSGGALQFLRSGAAVQFLDSKSNCSNLCALCCRHVFIHTHRWDQYLHLLCIHMRKFLRSFSLSLSQPPTRPLPISIIVSLIETPRLLAPPLSRCKHVHMYIFEFSTGSRLFAGFHATL